jgi:hypothetical protein
MIWFLEAGWEVFTPVADQNGTDIVIRHPQSRNLLSIQVKHKQRDSKNEGQLPNDWPGTEPPYDFLVFYLPARSRGLIIPKQKLKKEGKGFWFFKKDGDGYSVGPVRPLFADYHFDFSSVPHEVRSSAFVDRFSEIYNHTPNATERLSADS